jgi:hypothetical protein
MLDEDIKKAPITEMAPADAASDNEKQGTIEKTDLTAGIDHEIEKRVLRKFDLRILPLLTFMYLCS